MSSPFERRTDATTGEQPVATTPNIPPQRHLPSDNSMKGVPDAVSDLVSFISSKFLNQDMDEDDEEFAESAPRQMAALNTLSSILEYYEDYYQETTDHPLLDLREDFGIGFLLNQLGEDFIEELLQHYLVKMVAEDASSVEMNEEKKNMLLAVLRTLMWTFPAMYEQTFLMDDIMMFFSKNIKEFMDLYGGKAVNHEDSAAMYSFTKYVYCLGMIGNIMRISSDSTTYYIHDGIPQLLINQLKYKLENFPKKIKKKLLDVKKIDQDFSFNPGNNTFQELDYLELRFLITSLSILGEYMEVIQPIMQAGGSSLIIPLLKSKDKCLMSDGLKMSDSLLAHVVFAHQFFEKGCLKAILKLPHITYLAGGVSLCLTSIASYSDIMDKICRITSIAEKMTELGLGFLRSNHTELKRHGCHFFQNALAYVSVVNRFDKEDGLGVLLCK